MEYAEERLAEIAPAARIGSIRYRLRPPRAKVSEEGPFNAATWSKRTIWDARRRAKLKGLRMTITTAWVEKRLASIGYRCEVSGVPFCSDNPKGAHKRPFMPSLDRIDCAKGYVTDNVRIVCVAVNTLLQDWGEQVYIQITSGNKAPAPYGG